VWKATEMFSGKMKVLLFEDEEYKGPLFGNYNIDKNWGPLCKKIDWKSLW
jgi:hypothetical protein